MILKVHAKYLMDWINSVFVVLRVDILLSTYGNSTDVQKNATRGVPLLYGISLHISLEERRVCALHSEPLTIKTS